ncbi:MAG TPA: RHS repeat-associated core domain-containing protein [Pyrinomonadaceae bacterium]|nr:RHS repeat-associated core domain-containing protein [Pyrinomonadaceae bacterium]
MTKRSRAGGCAGSNYPFLTLKERDNETGLDYFGARYYGSTMGRFTSTDPIFTTLERLIDPQRLNLYSYTKNNPLRFTDGNGEDLALDAKSEEEAKKKYELFQKGLTKGDRSHTHFFVGDGKNGYRKGTFYVQVDKDYKSDSGNFTAVQTIANDRSGTAMVSLEKGGVKITELTAFREGGKIVLEDASEHFKGEVTPFTLGPQPDDTPTYGRTLFPVPTNPEVGQSYGGSKNIEVHVWNEQSDVEIVATMYHELRAHVYLSNMGRDPHKGDHGQKGVDETAKAAEAEAKKNFQQ